MYAVAGAVVGGVGEFLGSQFSESIFGGMRLVAPVVAVFFIGAATWQWLGPKLRQRRRIACTGGGADMHSGRNLQHRPQPGPLTRVGMIWRRRFEGKPYVYALGLGTLMSFLPCMLTAWVLGLALVSGSAIQGALLMILLVVMTTPALLPFALMPAGLPRWKWISHPAVGISMWYCSGIWMGLIALAANGVISHVSLAFGDWRVVLW